jgi:hypothetical protein
MSPQVESTLPAGWEVTPRREMRMRSSISETPNGEMEKIYPFYCPLCMEHFADILATPECCGNYICVRCVREYCETQGVDVPIGSSINDLISRLIKESKGGPEATHISCPQCMKSPYLPAKVKMMGDSRLAVEVRSYKDEVAVCSPQSSIGGSDGGPATSEKAGGEWEVDEVGRASLAGGSCDKKGTPDRVSKEDEGNDTTTATADVSSSSNHNHDAYSPVKVGDSFEVLKLKMKRFSNVQQKPSSQVMPGTPIMVGGRGDGDDEDVGEASYDGGGIDETRLGSPVRLVVNSFIDEALRMHSHSLAVQ